MFFQNVSEMQFRGVWVLGDRQASLDFDALPNQNKSDYQLSWVGGPYDFSGGGQLTINYAWDVDFKNYSQLIIDVTGANASATLPDEVAATLNADPIFSSMFVANVAPLQPLVPVTALGNGVLITAASGQPKRVIRVYISNSGAELVMRFNGQAPVAQLPSYFARHTIANRFNYPDCTAQLIQLDPATPSDAQIITNAGFDPTKPLADWQLLRGRCGLFMFQKITLDSSGRPTKIIAYPAGAKAGDFATQTDYTYSGAFTQPTQVTQIPYVLQSGDLIASP